MSKTIIIQKNGIAQTITVDNLRLPKYDGGSVAANDVNFFDYDWKIVAAYSTFTNIPTNCKIYIPTGSLVAYTSVNNYLSNSMYTYVEE